MDTTPFHLILFALDIVVLGGLFLWIRFRRNTGSARSAVYQYEKSLYAPIVARHPSFVWDVGGVLLCGGFGLFCFAVLSRLIFTDFAQKRIYHFNVGQCIAEGVAIHWTLFFLGAAALLYWNRRHSLAVFSSCCAIFLACASFNVLYWEVYHLKVEHYEIKTSKIKKRLRIVFVTDIQTDRVSSHEINTLKTIQKQKPDLIILGGDYIQTFLHMREKRLPEKFRQMLIDHPLEAPLGVYAIAGNIRDKEVSDAELFRDTSVLFVSDTTYISDSPFFDTTDWGPIEFVILNLGHSWGGLSSEENDQILGENDNFIIMAGHCPNYAIDGYTNPKSGRSLSGFRNAASAPDLMLAGHTHGGQVVIPFYGAIPFGGDERVIQVPRNMRSGFFTYPNGGHLLITRGSGVERGWAPRVRLFCPVEISVIDIVPE